MFRFTVLKVPISLIGRSSNLIDLLEYSLESFKVFHCSVIKVLCFVVAPHLAVSLIILPWCKSVVNTFLHLFQKYFQAKRRRRDLNPRAAVNDLHPFQGCPFGQLGYFCLSIAVAKKKEFLRILFHWCYHQAERVGFEPTRPCGQTVFKTASLWPLRYLSVLFFRNQRILY